MLVGTLYIQYVGSFKVYPPPGLTGRELQNAVSGFVWERITTINPKVLLLLYTLRDLTVPIRELVTQYQGQ